MVKKRKKCWSWIESSGNGSEEFKVYEDEFADIYSELEVASEVMGWGALFDFGWGRLFFNSV